MSDSKKKYVDIDKSIVNLKGRKNLLIKIARIYIENYETQLDQLQKSIDQKNAGQVKNAAHKIKGSLSNFAAQEAYNVAEIIERKADKGDLTDLQRDFEHLKQMMEDIADQLQSFIDETH